MLDRLFPHQQNVARYLPAISHGYAKVAADPKWQVGRQQGLKISCDPVPQSIRASRWMAGHHAGLPPGWWHLPLPRDVASAGQVMTESGGLSSARTMITERDPLNSFVVADSGGFQIQQGTLGPWRYQQTVLQSLRWQEAHGDYVMALDSPRRHQHGKMDEQHSPPHPCGRCRPCDYERRERAGYRLQRLHAANRSIPKLCFSIAGRAQNCSLCCKVPRARGRVWYLRLTDVHRDAEGIAFAGTSNTSVRLMLHRLIDLRDDGLLARIQHIHVLGTGTFESGCVSPPSSAASAKA